MTFLARVFGWLLSLAMGWAIAGILLLSGATIMARYIVAQIATLPEKPAYARSEERRVGKECRSRLSPYH